MIGTSFVDRLVDYSDLVGNRGGGFRDRIGFSDVGVVDVEIFVVVIVVLLVLVAGLHVG